MNDQEMALALGKKIIELRQENAILKSILDTCRTPDGSPLQWRQQLAEIAVQPPSLHIAQEQISLLRHKIGSPDESKSPVRTLHRHIEELGLLP